MKIQIINHHCTVQDISFAYAVHIREDQEDTKFRVWAIPTATKRGVRGQGHRSEKRELREGEGRGRREDSARQSLGFGPTGMAAGGATCSTTTKRREAEQQ
jgi:hypothetical protein